MTTRRGRQPSTAAIMIDTLKVAMTAEGEGATFRLCSIT